MSQRGRYRARRRGDKQGGWRRLSYRQSSGTASSKLMSRGQKKRKTQSELKIPSGRILELHTQKEDQRDE